MVPLRFPMAHPTRRPGADVIGRDCRRPWQSLHLRLTNLLILLAAAEFTGPHDVVGGDQPVLLIGRTITPRATCTIRRSFTRRTGQGMTATHPDVPAQLRGTYADCAIRRSSIIWKELGVTAIELMPVTSSCRTRVLRDQGLRNYWGYNTFGFLAPQSNTLEPDRRRRRSPSSRRWCANSTRPESK